jgi:hypothetical protein
MFSRKGLRTRNRAGKPAPAIFIFFSLIFLLLCPSLYGDDKLKDLQDRFDHDPRAATKIKTLEKLGLAQFDSASKAGRAGDYIAVGLIFEKYRDNVRAAFELLRKEEPDAERYGGLYRLLELQVRRAVREVEETLQAVPDPVRPPLQIVRQDLISLDDELIHLLFPRRSKDPEKAPAVPEAKP